jgi:hypothetical protein
MRRQEFRNPAVLGQHHSSLGDFIMTGQKE